MTKPLSGQVAELEAECNSWMYRAEAEAKYARDFKSSAHSLMAERDDLQRQVQEARDERDELRAGQGRWPRLGPATAPTVPRLITADELREGQWVAIWCIESGTTGLMAVLGVVERTNGRDVTLRSDCTGIPDWHNVAADGINIVLLEDAPEPEPGAWWLKKHPVPTAYGHDDHQDAEITDWHEPHRVVTQRPSDTEAIENLFHGRPGRIIPAPRLTVHDLEVAPAGSVLSFGYLERTKGPYGLWIADTGATFSNKGMIERGFEDATLTTPEGEIKHE